MSLMEYLNNPQGNPAMQQGLLQFGLSMLGQPGGNLLGNISRAGLQGLAGYQGAEDQMRQRSIQDQQLAFQRAQREAWEKANAQQGADDASQRAAIQSAFKPGQWTGANPYAADHENSMDSGGAVNMTPGQFDMQGYAESLAQAGNPLALQAFQALQKQAPELKAFDPAHDLYQGGQLVRPGAPKADTQPNDVREYQFAVSQGYPGTFQQWDIARRKAGASSTSVSYGAPVQALDSAGNPVFIQPTKDGSEPYVVPGVRPPLSPAEEKAAGEKKTRGMQLQQMTAVMDDAEAILRSGRATGSGIGMAIDAAGRAVGVTSPGAMDASRLEALSGWLVANVPRMEGPQSNFDVQNYKTMAGKVGDSSVPIKERLAALAAVRGLQSKYSAINAGAPAPAAPAPAQPGRVRRFNPATGKIED